VTGEKGSSLKKAGKSFQVCNWKLMGVEETGSHGSLSQQVRVLSVENVQLNGVRAVLRLAGKNGSLATARAVL